MLVVPNRSASSRHETAVFLHEEGEFEEMSSRTIETTVTFTHPFSLKGLDGPQPPGTYAVRADEELIEGMSFPAYRRTATAMSIPVPNAGPGSFQVIATDPQELEAALAADRAWAGNQVPASQADRPTEEAEHPQLKTGQWFRWNPFRSRRCIG